MSKNGQRTNPSANQIFTWIHSCKTGQPNSFGYESTGPAGSYRLASRPMTLPKGSVSVRRIFPMTAIALLKAWIPFCANEWWTRIKVKKQYLQQHVCGSQYNRGQKNPAYNFVAWTLWTLYNPDIGWSFIAKLHESADKNSHHLTQ